MYIELYEQVRNLPNLKEQMKKRNRAAFVGTWEDIRKEIIRTFDEFEFFFFINPDTNKENLIIPSKFTKEYFERATERDLKRISVR